jgi:hypothetical protein
LCALRHVNYESILGLMVCCPACPASWCALLHTTHTHTQTVTHHTPSSPTFSTPHPTRCLKTPPCSTHHTLPMHSHDIDTYAFHTSPSSHPALTKHHPTHLPPSHLLPPVTSYDYKLDTGLLDKLDRGAPAWEDLVAASGLDLVRCGCGAPRCRVYI